MVGDALDPLYPLGKRIGQPQTGGRERRPGVRVVMKPGEQGRHGIRAAEPLDVLGREIDVSSLLVVGRFWHFSAPQPMNRKALSLLQNLAVRLLAAATNEQKIISPGLGANETSCFAVEDHLNPATPQ